MTLLFSFTAAVFFLIVLFSARGYVSASRTRRFRELELKPNCLLTRYPLVFITKQKSLFDGLSIWRGLFRDDWNDIPKYLREHGYEVLILTPNPADPFGSIVETLSAYESKYHLIASEREQALVERLADFSHPKVVSYTLARFDGRGLSNQKAKISIADLRPLNVAVEVIEISRRSTGHIWELEEHFLDHAISLAERDAGWCD